MSLTNEPEKLINTALDTLSQIMSLECCWIQTISGAQNQQLFLAAERGFSNEMRSEIISMDMGHDFSRQIIGIGHKIVIPDLNNDGVYWLASFKAAGYKWLVAVPLMTYRVYGILGAASPNKKRLEKETSDLIMVIAGMIASALSKAHLSRSFGSRNKPPESALTEPVKETKLPEAKTEATTKALLPDTKIEEKPVAPAADLAPKKHPPKRVDPVFHSHKRKMESFRKAHG